MDGGSSFSAAVSLGKQGGATIVQNAISNGESSDFFKFSVRSLGNVNLTLGGLSGNANLRLFDVNGKQLASSTRGGARTDWISRTLSRGTYTVAVDRATGAANTNYALTIQSDLNWDGVTVDGKTYSIGLVRADGSSAAISPVKNTWVVIHGWLGNLSSTNRLADAIDGASKRDQVLQLDWSAPAGDADVATTAFRVDDIAAVVADKLEFWGLTTARINLVGHSLGGGMTDQIARRISGGVNTIIALDPATVALGDIDLSGTNFAAHSQRSLAFIGSNYSTAAAARTADTAVRLNVGNTESFVTHDRVKEIFATMTARNNTGSPDPISIMLSLSNIARGLPFKADAAGSGFEAVLSGDTEPSSLSYTNSVTGKAVTIRD